MTHVTILEENREKKNNNNNKNRRRRRQERKKKVEKSMKAENRKAEFLAAGETRKAMF